MGLKDWWKGESLTIENVQLLNKDAGTLTEELKIVSPKTVHEQGNIQAATLAIAEAYVAGDDAYKTKLETAGLIVDDRGDSKKVNPNILFDAAKAVGADKNIEQRAAEIAQNITKLATDNGVTEKQINDAVAVVNSKKGVNRDGLPFVPPINVAAKAVSPDLAKVRDAILPMQALLRSNTLDIVAGDLKLDEKDFDFNIPTLGFLPEDVKKIIDAGRQTAERVAKGEKPFIEDVEVLEKALDKTLVDLDKIQKDLGNKIDLSPLIKRIQKLDKETKALFQKNETEIKTKLRSAPRGIKFAAIEDEDIADVEISANPLADDGPSTKERFRERLQKAAADASGATKGLKDKWQGFQQNRKDKAAQKEQDAQQSAAHKDIRQEYLKAIVAGFGNDNIAANPIEEFKKGDGLDNLIKLTDIKSTEAGETVFEAKDKSYSFTIDETGVTHNDTDESVSVEEAILTADLIRLNAKAHKGVEIVGNDEQKAMYFAAMKQFAPDVPIKNLDEIQKIAPAILQRAEIQFTAPQPKAGGAGMGGGPTGGTVPT